jgi:hypothetical protein
MRLFEIAYPTEDGDITEILTEEEVIQQYFPYWSSKMKEVGKEDLINKESCIEDWCIVHWASEIKIPV